MSKLFTRTLEVVFIELGGITLFYTSLILTGNVIILALFGWLGAWYGLWPIVVMTFVGEYGALLARGMHTKSLHQNLQSACVGQCGP